MFPHQDSLTYGDTENDDGDDDDDDDGDDGDDDVKSGMPLGLPIPCRQS